MKQIYKYPLSLESEQSIQLPVGSGVLDCKEQNGVPTLWVLQDVETQGALTDVLIKIVGTGEQFELDNWHYLRTVMIGEFVWHIFMRE